MPARLCENQECRCLFGGASFLIYLMPFNGWFYSYTGAYLPALWRWLTGWPEDE